MREIKFRAWSTGKMSEVNIIQKRDDGSTQYYTENKTEICNCGNKSCVFVIGEIMQYIGLKDKNGKEIYEGDVIQWLDSDGNKRIHEVEYKRGFFFICNYNYHIDNYPEIEIIGNIYKNPELLEE